MPATERSQLLTTPQAAEFLGIAPNTLEVWRCTRRYGIPYLRVGRLIKYRVADLERWLVSREQSALADAK